MFYTAAVNFSIVQTRAKASIGKLSCLCLEKWLKHFPGSNYQYLFVKSLIKFTSQYAYKNL